VKSYGSAELDKATNIIGGGIHCTCKQLDFTKQAQHLSARKVVYHPAI